MLCEKKAKKRKTVRNNRKNGPPAIRQILEKIPYKNTKQIWKLGNFVRKHEKKLEDFVNKLEKWNPRQGRALLIN